MTEGTERRGGIARLVEVQVADGPEGWTRAGFTVEGDVVQLGTVTFRLVGDHAGRGIVGWSLSGIGLDGGDDLDGLATTVVPAVAPPPAPVHPNGTTGLDHVVVVTPDLDRTLAALAAAGLELRRIRDTSSRGGPMRQAFFRLGPTVLEVVSGDLGSGAPAGEAPATWWGLAIDVDDLDATAAVLGSGLGSIKAAVQPGRRIATLRHRDLGVSVAVAAMDHRAEPTATVDADR